MSSPSPVKLFFGWLLMAVGGLIALTCGLCTVGFLTITAANAMRSGTGSGAAPMVLLSLLIGGLPTVLGAGVFVAGWEVTRKRAPGSAP